MDQVFGIISKAFARTESKNFLLCYLEVVYSLMFHIKVYSSFGVNLSQECKFCM